jgi:hypothetical protein
MILLGRIKVARINQQEIEESKRLEDLGLDVQVQSIEGWSPILIDLDNVATMFPSSTYIGEREVNALDITLKGSGFNESIIVLVNDPNLVLDSWIEEKGLIPGSFVDEYE